MNETGSAKAPNRALIDEWIDSGSVEFVSEFARPLSLSLNFRKARVS